MYVITDKTVYLKTCGGHKVVNSLGEAGKYKFDKANNIIKSMPTELREYSWQIECATVSKSAIIDTSTGNNFNYDLDYEISRMEKFAKDLKEQEKILIAKLQKMEFKIVDLEHYVEFYNADMYSAWKYYKLFQDVMRERRCIKDEIAIINYILNSNMKSASNNLLSKAVSRLNERQYSPRVLKDLFNEKNIDDNNLRSYRNDIASRIGKLNLTDLNYEEEKDIKDVWNFFKNQVYLSQYLMF